MSSAGCFLYASTALTNVQLQYPTPGIPRSNLQSKPVQCFKWNTQQTMMLPMRPQSHKGIHCIAVPSMGSTKILQSRISHNRLWNLALSSTSSHARVQQQVFPLVHHNLTMRSYPDLALWYLGGVMLPRQCGISCSGSAHKVLYNLQ